MMWRKSGLSGGCDFDEAFVTNALMGMLPVRQLDDVACSEKASGGSLEKITMTSCGRRLIGQCCEAI